MDPYIGLLLFFLLSLSALFSGLTLGLFSLDKTELERKSELGDTQAARVLRVRKRGNLLLVSLLLGNVAVNAAISLFLGQVASGVVAGLVATGLIVVFGEIIPQATCARYALLIGAKTSWIVEGLLVLLYPIAKPIAWILDKTLGEELRTIWTKRELEHIIQMHEDDPRSSVDADEERILLGALRFSDTKAKEVMTPRKEVYMLTQDRVLDDLLLYEIRDMGYTRIPVFVKGKKDVVGLLYSKDLIGVDGDEGKDIEDFLRTSSLVRVTPTRPLDSVLNAMIGRRAHMAVVTDKQGDFVGLVTMEDILEEILGREIEDEADDV
jgi:metal transporter CNNM